MTLEYNLIDTLTDLEDLCDRLGNEKMLAVDIEADSFHHYFPKVCLIQVSTDRETFIVDPLATETVAPLKPLLENARIQKVIHGADYDIRSMYRDFLIKMENVFDTMIASRFLGEKELGLAAILKSRYGIVLNKKYQKANWARRPLPEAMLVYASQDTAHLIRLQQVLEEELRQCGRLTWVEEECDLLISDCTQGGSERATTGEPETPSAHGNPEGKHTPLFRKFKGAGTMSRRNLAVLERILAYREKHAMQQDRPPFKIFSNMVIKELVKKKPTDMKTLKNMPGLPASFVARYAKGVLRAIKSGLAVKENRLPIYPRTARPPSNPGKHSRLKKLKIWREKMAEKLDLEPGVVCNNALLDALAHANPDSLQTLTEIQGMKKWQQNLLGREIIDTLQGGS